VAVAILLMAVLAGPALAKKDPSAVHDNRGTVKIHEGAGEPAAVMASQPQVCEFHVHGFKFHDNQELEISIVGHGGNAGPSVYESTVTTDENGEFRDPASGAIALSDGTYKLTVATGHGNGGKHKKLMIDCPEEQPVPGAGGANPPAPVPGSGGENPPGPVPGSGGANPPGTNPVPGQVPAEPPKPGLLPNSATDAVSDWASPQVAAYAFAVALAGLLTGSLWAVSRRRALG
jgi:hypothetical protein